jgi:methyl-accepting chemotaxis protein
MSEDLLERAKELAKSTTAQLKIPRAVITVTPGKAETFSASSLLGKLIYVVGEGLKGAYITHKITRGYEGARYWVITYGLVTIIGTLKGGEEVVLYANGQPTNYVLQYPPNAFQGFYVATKAVGTVTVREADIKNLEEVTEGKSTVLILDPHGLMGAQMAPLDAVNKIAQLQADLDRLARTAYEYEQAVLEYKGMVNELNARVAKYQELYNDLTQRVAKYAQELLDLQVSLDSIRNEIKQLNRESDNYDKMVQEINDKMASLVATIKDLARIMSEVPQPPPVPAGKGTETEEKEGGEGGKSGKSAKS